MECMLAAGVKRSLRCDTEHALKSMDGFISSVNSWLFGHLAYELKNELEGFAVPKTDHVGFADLFFFEPVYLLKLSEDKLEIYAPDPDLVYKQLENDSIISVLPSNVPEIKSRLTKEEYISIIKNLQNHILRGDCYEINFFQEFYANGISIDPVTVYQRLSQISPNPFSALYRNEDHWLICASPERFLKKDGNKILSQPIKGTSKRILENEKADNENKEQLQQSPKDRSENVMVVDLVRNDLSKICEEGSVKVDELYGVYSFPQVHQLISTISGKLKNNITFSEIISACFPMGSMTGAPKKRVMELIDLYEKQKRGIFSGALGYITPENDFDFNVVIRSIMYNSSTGYLSLQAGSGITFYSDPELEWQECMMKAEAMTKALKS